MGLFRRRAADRGRGDEGLTAPEARTDVAQRGSRSNARAGGDDDFDPFGDLGAGNDAPGRSDATVGVAGAAGDGEGAWEPACRSQVAPPPRRARRSRPVILTVCTGNVCRSPYMERLLQQQVGGVYEVRSAGTGALVGYPMDPSSAKLLEEQGISAQRFISQQLTEDLVAEASLILTATRDHRREVVQLAPVGLKKTFALGDLAHAVSQLPAEAVTGVPGQERLAALLEAVELYRPQLNVLPAESVYIVDPFKQDEAVFRTMQKQTDPQVQMMARGLVG